MLTFACRTTHGREVRDEQVAAASEDVAVNLFAKGAGSAEEEEEEEEETARKERLVPLVLMDLECSSLRMIWS